jgi:hypothetical protein
MSFYNKSSSKLETSKHRLLRTHMEDIWHWCHYDPMLWIHSPCPWHYQFWHIMSMVCPYIISPWVMKKYPHHIGLFPGLGNIWHMPPHNLKLRWCDCPIHEHAQFSFLQLDCSTYFVVQKNWNHKNNKK